METSIFYEIMWPVFGAGSGIAVGNKYNIMKIRVYSLS